MSARFSLYNTDYDINIGGLGGFAPSIRFWSWNNNGLLTIPRGRFPPQRRQPLHCEKAVSWQPSL